jgi:acyl-CoA synthetase (AMP-forming)/AMP-acid ligase II
VIERSAYGPDICRTVRDQRVTGLAGVPALWEMLTHRPSTFLSDELPHLRYVTNSGEMLRLPTLERIRRAHPHVAVYLMYGFTEAFRATYLEPELADAHPTSIGGPIPFTEGLVVDDGGDPCPDGTVGEYLEAGATVAMGYWRNPRATALVYRPDPRGGPQQAGRRVVHSGDLVRRQEGLLHYVGRRDEQMKIQGMKVSPTEVEVVLAASRLVAQSVVFTARGPDGRVVLTAVVVPADPDGFDPAALEAHCRRELPTFLQPDTIVVQDELPKSSWSKVDRARVKAEHSPRLDDEDRWRALAPAPMAQS